MSVTLALLVSLSTLSFTVDTHYCGNSIVDVAIFQKAKGCGMQMQKPATEGCAITKKNCCDDRQFVVDGQDELKLQLDKISFEQQVFIASFVYAYINLFESLNDNVSSYEEYRPPLVIRQLYKIDESYLI